MDHEQIQKDLTEIKIKLAEISQLCQVALKNEKVLHGNGKEGLIVEVDRIKRTVSMNSRIAWLIVGVLVASELPKVATVIRNLIQ